MCFQIEILPFRTFVSWHSKVEFVFFCIFSINSFSNCFFRAKLLALAFSCYKWCFWHFFPSKILFISYACNNSRILVLKRTLRGYLPQTFCFNWSYFRQMANHSLKIVKSQQPQYVLSENSLRYIPSPKCNLNMTSVFFNIL